jgi:ATP-dependent helicase IRC3
MRHIRVKEGHAWQCDLGVISTRLLLSFFYIADFASNLSMFRTAKWRREPATDGQKTLLARRLRLKETSLPTLSSDVNEPSTALVAVRHARKPIALNTITRGEAANALTRIFHGAVKHFSDKIKAQSKLEKADAKRRRHEDLQKVCVGPLPL